MAEITFDQILDAIQRNADASARLLVAADLLKQAQEGDRHNNNSVQFVVPSPDSGERAALRTEKYTYLLGGLLIGTVMWFGLTQLDQGRKIERTQDYLNMLWRTYPETRDAALKAHEERKNGQSNRN